MVLDAPPDPQNLIATSSLLLMLAAMLRLILGTGAA